MRRHTRSFSTPKNRIGAVGLVLFLGIAVVPIVFSLGYALAYSTGLTGLLSDGFTLAQWGKLFVRGEIWASFGWSLYVAVLTLVLTVSLALLLALYLRRPLQYGPLSYVIYFPLALPATVAAFLVFQIFSGAGYGARVALSLGLIDEVGAFPSIIHDAYGIGIIAAHVSLAVPFFTLLFVQVYQSEKIDALTQLAHTLGARRIDTLYRVSIPILLTKSTTNIILLFIAVLGSYEIPLLLGKQSTQMISVLTMRKYGMFDLAQKPEAFVIALLYTSLVLVLIVIAFRRRKMDYDLQ